MSIKKVLLSKKISNTIYDIFPKTSADVVVYGETTVASELAKFANDLKNVYTKSDTDTAITTSANNLYNKIMGITEEDGATVTEAYDTLKEVAAWIEEHGDVATGFTTDISALKTAVGDADSGLVKGLADANAAIASNDSDIEDLQNAVNALETALGDANSGLTKRVADLESTVGNADSGLVKNVTDLQTKVESLIEVGGTKVEKSEINGNVKVDGVEVNVYTHPETHDASMIVEDDTHKFVTAAEKAQYAAAAAVVLVTSQDEIDNERDLYMVELI